MFDKQIYIERRRRLVEQIGSGLILMPGNDYCPMNYPDNTYPFRQDSSFLYYFGLDDPGLAAVIDADLGSEFIFGDDLTVDDIIWTGSQPSVKECSALVGVEHTAPMKELADAVNRARGQGRAVHYLPQYRGDNIIAISELLGTAPAAVADGYSVELTKAVIAQRSYKTEEEIEQIEIALGVCYEMQVAAMKTARPGVYEREIAGMMEGIALSADCRLSFPTIFSIHGETLHNHSHANLMNAGDIAVNDSGAESPLHYAGDITRTIPIGGKFDSRQRDVYSIVYDSQTAAIDAVKPGVEFRNVHLLAASRLLAGLNDLGLTRGDPDEAARAGAHTLFFQCGLGHMMGLDVHDMEGLGEDYVGYTDKIKRNPEFGFRSLRLGKALEPGFVITVEPGLYFIPQLIDRFRADNKFAEFINYDKVETFRDFGGVRLEDDVLVTENGRRLLGKPIPRTIDEVEELCSA